MKALSFVAMGLKLTLFILPLFCSCHFHDYKWKSDKVNADFSVDYADSRSRSLVAGLNGPVCDSLTLKWCMYARSWYLICTCGKRMDE